MIRKLIDNLFYKLGYMRIPSCEYTIVLKPNLNKLKGVLLDILDKNEYCRKIK